MLLRNIFPCIIFFLMSVITFAQTEKSYASKDARYKFYEDFSKKYNSQAILEIWKADKTKSFDEYVDGKSQADLLESYSTVIHELLHAYNTTENSGHTYFIDAGIRIHVPFTEVFNSKELNKYVRKGLQDSVFRYGLYIGGKSELPGLGKVKGVNDSKQNEAMSVQLGVYGILEEFSAYYFGAEAAFEHYDFYLTTYGKDKEEIWETYTQELEGELVAFYEFQLFIAWYLNYAKEKHPKMYTEIQNNKAFKVVYSLIFDKYQDLVNKTADRKNEIASWSKTKENTSSSDLDFSGSEEDFLRFLVLAGLKPEEIYKEKTETVNGKRVTNKEFILEEEDLAMLKTEYQNFVKQFQQATKTEVKGDMLLFYSQFDKQFEFLKKQFTPKVTEELQKLYLQGVTSKNYQTFLK